jgi:hypothetical protein
MKLIRTLLLLVSAGAVTLSAADLSKFVEAKRWEIAECTAQTAGTALVVNMPIDHKGGQKEYPIGWPRLYMRKFLPAENNWSGAKAISFDLKLEFTGKTAAYPLTLHIFWRPKDARKNESTSVRCPVLKNNAVNKVVIPFSSLKGFDPAVVCGLGFNISESQFKHGENFKFTVSNFKLVTK